MTVFSYFTDAVLRGPTIGSMLMCLSAALVGVIVFLRKQSLIGEALSHAAYPGVIVGVIVSGLFVSEGSDDLILAITVIVGAFISAMLGLLVFTQLERKLKIRSDSALCFVLSAFFGIGLTLASHIQFTHTSLYRQAQAYLYGQAATMTDAHIAIYGSLAFVLIITIIILGKELRIITFNREFAKSMGIPVRMIDLVIAFLTVLAVVVGIRSVGVVLMSAMLIAPPAAARQFTNKFHVMMILAACFGLASGFLGNYFSVELSLYLSQQYPSARLAIPTGPMIVLVASVICLLSLLFAPERGLLLRLTRMALFRYQCIQENILKAFWRHGPQQEISFDQMRQFQSASPLYLRAILMSLVYNGWLKKTGSNTYLLTSAGQLWAAKVVRLHRLWEVYLADYLGVGAERVHCNAEEMEHILTPEIEQELILLLKNPQMDPHQQRIPSKEGS